MLARPGRPGAAARRLRGRPRARSYWVAFTPDGRTLVFAGGLGAAQIAAVAGGRAARVHGSAVRRLVARRPLRLRVRERRDDRDRGRRSARGARRSSSRGCPTTSKGVSGLAWLGDGSALLYNGSAPDRADLWTMRADGSEQRRLAGTARPVAQPAWNADGTKLAYSSHGRSRDGSIVVADARRPQALVVAGARPGEHSNDGNPSWAPGRDAASRSTTTSRPGISVVDVAGRQPHARSPSTASRRRGRPTASRSPSSTSTTARSGGRPDRRRSPPAAARLGAQGPVGRLVAGRQALAFSTDTGIYVAVPDGTSAARLVVTARLPGAPELLTRRPPARLRRRRGHRPPATARSPSSASTAAGGGSSRPARTTAPTRPGDRRALSRRRGRGGRACRAAPAACRPRG